jgi:hypothetical protein
MVRVLPDANDVLVFQLNESGPTRLNAGTAGAAGNWTDHGQPISNVQGLLGDAMYIPGTNLTSSADGSGGANDVLITPNISLSGWVFVRRYSSSYGELFNKQYFLNGWSAPYLTFGFQMVNSNDGQTDLYITIGGVLQTQLRTPISYVLPVGKWCHIGGTWNGTTMKFYLNGNLITSTNYTGAIDYGTVGNRGQWYVGNIPGGAANAAASAIVQDIRVANIERPQSYFANIFYQGMFVNG